MSGTGFTWRDGDRTILFGPNALADAPRTLAEHDWPAYELLTTERALAAAPVLGESANSVHHVRAGAVNEISAELVGAVGSESLVAYGGGRVIDVAKAIAAVAGGRVAAIPTTLSGAEMTRIHKLPDGHEVRGGLNRPALVIADPQAMTAQPEHERRASAMNALAHAADSLPAPYSHPLSRTVALESARLIASGLEGGTEDDLALGALLAGYSIDTAGLSIHHVICQSLVRVLRVPHAETNAAILPHAIDALIPRSPDYMERLAAALGTATPNLPSRIEALGGGRRSLGEIGADAEKDAEKLDEALDLMEGRRELGLMPDPPTRDELRGIIEAAW